MNVIEGEGKAGFKPRLVKNAEGHVCMEITFGNNVATLALPAALNGATEERLKDFYDVAVKHMTQGLQDIAQKDRRKQRRKAARC